MEDTVKRCAWVKDKPDYYIEYHDCIWGKPEHDDQQLFQWLVLESFHVGLSWQLVLSKQANFAKAFDNFDYQKIADYTEAKVAALREDAGIIRHIGKIRATITNAQAFLKVQEEFDSFDAYIWGFTEGKVVLNQDDALVTSSELSDRVTYDLKKRGFKFIGSVTIYSYLQAIGMINDHELTCDFR